MGDGRTLSPFHARRLRSTFRDVEPSYVHDVVVIGASAAGLAVAASLKTRGIDAVLLEQHEHVGHAWRNHYQRLHLHTSRGLSGLPGLPMPKSYPRYPSRQQVVDYLEAYRQHFDLSPRYGQTVKSVQREGDLWLVETTDEMLQARRVVVATGYTRQPVRPRWPGMDDYTGELLHSSEYSSGATFSGSRVLVVGFGNSACEIAIDLVEQGAEPTLAVRGPVNVVPRDVFGIPILGVGIAMSFLPAKVADLLGKPIVAASIGNIEDVGLRRLPYGPNTQIREHGRIPLLDIGTIDLIRKKKIAVRPGIDSFHDEGVVFADGRREDFAAVVLGTGYRPALAEFVSVEGIDAKTGSHEGSGYRLDDDLYLCGLYVSPTGMLREIGIEATRIADDISSRSATN